MNCENGLKRNGTVKGMHGHSEQEGEEGRRINQNDMRVKSGMMTKVGQVTSLYFSLKPQQNNRKVSHMAFNIKGTGGEVQKRHTETMNLGKCTERKHG